MYWFIERKSRTETRENVYLMTMVSRQSRQIVGFDVTLDKPYAEKYCTDGYAGYMDVVFPGWHIRNIHNKSDTFTVEGINADLRHYIPILARTLETLQAVVGVFVEEYNRFGVAKCKYRQRNIEGGFPFSLIDFF